MVTLAEAPVAGVTAVVPAAQGRQAHRKVRQVSGNAPIEPLLTVAEVAGMLRVSNMTVYRLIKNGQLGAIRVGKNYRIRQADLDAYLNAGSVHAEQSNR